MQGGYIAFNLYPCFGLVTLLFVCHTAIRKALVSCTARLLYYVSVPVTRKAYQHDEHLTISVAGSCISTLIIVKYCHKLIDVRYLVDFQGLVALSTRLAGRGHGNTHARR